MENSLIKTLLLFQSSYSGQGCYFMDYVLKYHYLGNDLPRRYGEFPLEFASTPICDIDPFYLDKKTFIVISKGGTIFRFSAEKAMFLLSPFHPIRWKHICMLFFNLFPHRKVKRRWREPETGSKLTFDDWLRMWCQEHLKLIRLKHHCGKNFFCQNKSSKRC